MKLPRLSQLCKIIAGQRYTKSLSRGQRQAQIAACKQSPRERQNICENVSPKDVGVFENSLIEVVSDEKQ